MKAEGEAAGKSGEFAACLETLATSASDKDADLLGLPPPRPECPICMLALPIDDDDSMYMACCGKEICCGCIHENRRVIMETNKKNARRNRDTGRPPLKDTCAFCRKPPASDSNDLLAKLEERMALNDEEAFSQIGGMYMYGRKTLPQDDRKAFDHFLRAAELGSAGACGALAMYCNAGLVSNENREMERFYLEMGSKRGGIKCRDNLGILEHQKGNIELAIRHWLISAGAGYQPSLDNIKSAYKRGDINKDRFAEALRSFQAARDREKSEGRDRWAAEKTRI